MDEASLRGLLERATVPEPPAGPIARNALRAGLRLRRRRRAQGIAGAVTVCVVCAGFLAVSGAAGHQTATRASETATVYVLGGGTGDTVTPISAATNTPGRPIVIAGMPASQGSSTSIPGYAVAPGGKTIWVADGSDSVTPISTATNRAGKPVKVVHDQGYSTEQVVITPDGKTAYVLDSTGAITPVSTATSTPGKPIKLGGDHAGYQMAITPDGKTLYVTAEPFYVIPIATATNTPGKPIRLKTTADAIVVTPDGKTAYAVGETYTIGAAAASVSRTQIDVTPIATATNTAGKPVVAGTGSDSGSSSLPVVITPDGQTIYIAPGSPNLVIPFSTTTNTPGTPISFGAATVSQIAITPDGRTAYVASQPPGLRESGNPFRSAYACAGPPGAVTPIATATSTAGKPVKVGCQPVAIAITPDGKTVYVASLSGAVTPIATATGQPGKPIKVDGPVAVVIVP
jgi:DNA-binding beta-propeller fold protein YncE